MNELTRQAIAVNQANLALGSEVFQAEGATFVRNRACPEVHDANYVTQVQAESPEEIERLLRRVELEFVATKVTKFNLDFDSSPPFEARLLLEGYENPRADLIMVLNGPLKAASPSFEIAQIDDNTGWQAFTELKRLDFQEYLRNSGQADEPGVADQLAIIAMAKAPPVRYWLAYVDGIARGFFSSWSGLNGMGQVEDLFVHPDFRHRGIATALMQRCVADCRDSGAESIAIVCDADDTPKDMYAAMGFQPVAVKRGYTKSKPTGF